MTMTAQFYKQDAHMRPNLTIRGPNLARTSVTAVKAKKRKGHKRAAREEGRPMVIFVLLSLQCRAPFGQVSPTWVRLAPLSASCL